MTDLQHEHQLNIQQLRRSFETSHHNALEDLQASLLAESAIQLAATKLQAERDAEMQLEKMQQEMNEKIEEKLNEMQREERKSIEETAGEASKTSRQKMDAVIMEMKSQHAEELESLVDDSSNNLQVRIYIIQYT